MLLPRARDRPAGDDVGSVNRIEDSIGWHEHVTLGKGRDGEETAFGTENAGRNIVMCMNLDGVTPFKRSQDSYTPMQCMIYNLPENLRHRKPFVLLPAMIPGPKAPKTYTPYLQMLVDELTRLYDFGFKVKDPLTNKLITVKVKLLCTSCDLPAHAATNEQQTSSAHFGCMKCEIQVRTTDTHVGAVDDTTRLCRADDESTF